MVFKPGNGLVDYANAAGPASYDSSSRPTLTFPNIKYIRSISDVKITATGYVVDVTGISGNIATYRVANPTAAHTHVFAGSALASHTHNLSPAASSAGALSGTLGTLTGTNLIISKVAAQTITGAITSAVAGTPSGVNVNNTAAVGSEVANSTNLSGVTFYGQAFGYPSQNNS